MGVSMLNLALHLIAIIELVCVGMVLFAERKRPASSMAWVLVLIFLPVIGFLLYLVFGTGFRVNKRRRYAIKSLVDAAYTSLLCDRLAPGREEHHARHPANARPLDPMRRAGDGSLTTDNAAEVFTDGSACFSRMLEDIRRAKHHVHLLYFIFRCDGIGSEILSCLTEKARQGVEIRLMYDSLGSFFFVGRKLRELKQAGGQVLAFAPIFSSFSSSFQINYRNHRKITVVDGRVGYVGGMNVGDEYLGRHPRLRPWRDTTLRLTGSAVWFLQGRFLMDWSYCSDREPQAALPLDKFFPTPACNGGHLGVQIASSGPDTDESPIKYGLLSLFYTARRTLYIQTPYYAPDVSILDALQAAARSGVDVRLMIPKLFDHWIVHKSTLGYARQMLASGVRVFLYQGFLHAKTVVADGAVATIGTSNLSIRSFTQNFEVNAFIHDASFATAQEKLFLRDQENCREVTEEWFAARPWTVRAAYNVSRLLAPLI